MSKKFRLLMALVLVIGLFGGLMTGSTVSADPTPGDFIEIPRIDVGDVFGTGAWETQIQIQNLGPSDTTVTVDFFAALSFLCPPNDPGAFYTTQMWVPAGGVWTLHNQIPAGAESAFVTHTPTNWPFAADLAVTVDRWGPDAYGEFELSSSYTGISDPEMVGPGPRYEYYAPYVMHGYNDLDTTLAIQNSGEICASIWIYYKEEGNCEFMKAQHIENIAPGEAIRIGPGVDADRAYPSPELDRSWLGSAYVTANVPLAIIVDQLSHAPSANRATLSTMRGLPYRDQWNLNWYADLLYREISGWDASIQVQNLTIRSTPTFVTVEFFDQSGDSILFVGDWICRNGARTFYLPAITDLGVNFPFGYVGAAEIQSHGQVDYPGGWHSGEQIFAVVDLKKSKVYDNTTGFWRHTVAGETQAGAYNAHPQSQKENAYGWAMPYIAKEQMGVTSRIAIRNNANCNKITGDIYIVDETGNVVTVIPVSWLHPKHMQVIDLAYFGQIARGFVGAAFFVVDGVEQLCDNDFDGHVDNLPIMPSVVVLNYGFATELPIGSGAGPLTDLGDLTRVYEAIPYGYDRWLCDADFMGKVHNIDPCETGALDNQWPINLVDVSTVEYDPGPFNVSGHAYIGTHCGAGSDGPLAGATVKLYAWLPTGAHPDDPQWAYSLVDERTTGATGYFLFQDALEKGVDYRLRIYVEVAGNTKTYDEYYTTKRVPGDGAPAAGEGANGDWVADFQVGTLPGGEIDKYAGLWCAEDFLDPAIVDRPDTDQTNSTGDYEVEDVAEGSWTVEFAKTGFLTLYSSVSLECGEDEVLDAELMCIQGVDLHVVKYTTTENGGTYHDINGASVTFAMDLPAKAEHYPDPYTDAKTTDAVGGAILTVPLLNTCGTFTVVAPGIAETATFAWNPMLNAGTFTGTNGKVGVAATAAANCDEQFDEIDCDNIDGAYDTLSCDEDGERLVLCGFGTAVGTVTVGGIAAPGRLVEVIQGGLVVGTGTTDANGNYIIEDIPTGAFATPFGFYVRANGIQSDNQTWTWCGEVHRVNFAL